MHCNQAGSDGGRYGFTTDWFSPSWENWLTLSAERKISKLLEIGSFEGRSTCTMIEHFGKQHPLDLICVDNFPGSPELAPKCRGKSYFPVRDHLYAADRGSITDSDPLKLQ